MDLKDRKIIQELTLNSRIPLNQLAKQIESKQSTTLYRLQRLKEKEIILGTHAIIDTYKLGFRGYRMYFSFLGTKSETETEIFEWLKEQKETPILGMLDGSANSVIIYWSKKRLEFYDFIKRFKEKYGEFITNIEINEYVKTNYFPRNYLTNERRKDTITIGEKDKIETYDETDVRILKLLSLNARTHSLEIAKQIGTTAQTIIQRIKHLERVGIIKGYGINLNTNKINYTYYKLSISFIKNIEFSKLLSFTNTIENSVYVDETTSKYDYELNIEVENEEKLDLIITKIKNEFEGIKEIKIYRSKKFLKFSFEIFN